MVLMLKGLDLDLDLYFVLTFVLTFVFVFKVWGFYSSGAFTLLVQD